MDKAAKRNRTVKYNWCQYVDDANSGLFTIRKITTEDDHKVFSQAEAIFKCNQLNEGDGNG